MPIDLSSPNHDARPEGMPVDMLVLHYTGMPDGPSALARLTDPAAKVSAHYCIGEDGTVWRLVDETRRAWHAGVSSWRGHRDINARSIGIELVNPGHEWGYRAFPSAQMAALVELCHGILVRHPAIAPRNVVGHSDVAPQRKQDPGELFDWPGLARLGVGLWPEPFDGIEAAPDAARARSLLQTIGYVCEGFAAALTAFQRHFRPARCDGALDAQTMGRLERLARAAGGD